MASFETPYSLVIVDDDEDIGELIAEKINQMLPEKFAIKTFAEPKVAFEFVEKNDVRVLISDINMPGMFGDVFLNKCRELEKGIMTISMTGYPSYTIAIMRYRDGDMGFIVKPIDYDQLKNYLTMCLTNLDYWAGLIRNVGSK